MISKKIPAFTLTEMLIVLAISTIIAGLAFTIISLFGRNIQAIENNYSLSTELNLFEQQMTIDFNRFHTVSYNINRDELSLKTPLDSIVYKFDEGFTLRNLDTLLSQKMIKKLYFSGKEIKEGEIDAVEFKLTENQKNSSVFIYKENDATFYLNENGN